MLKATTTGDCIEGTDASEALVAMPHQIFQSDIGNEPATLWLLARFSNLPVIISGCSSTSRSRSMRDRGEGWEVDSRVGGPSLNRVSQDNRNNSVEPGKKE